MAWIEPVLVALVLLGSVGAFGYVLWTQRLAHVWPKRGDVQITNPGGFFPGVWEVLSQNVVLRNRPWVGLFHLPLFFGLLAFLFKSLLHVLAGLGLEVERRIGTTGSWMWWPSWSWWPSCSLVVRRYFVEREKMTHPLESGIILALIALLMITHLLEQVGGGRVGGGVANWWGHFLVLAVFPAVIAHGKHLHLVLAPVNVVLKHMTELPSDRPVFGNDLDMDLEDESKLEAEYARLGMAGGVADFSFGPLFDQAACIQCGRCNDACPAGPDLKPRDHFVLALQNPGPDRGRAGQTHRCRCGGHLRPVQGLRGGLPHGVQAWAECPGDPGPPHARRALSAQGLRDTAMKALASSGNIFGVDGERSRFIKENDFPIYDPAGARRALRPGMPGREQPRGPTGGGGHGASSWMRPG